MNISNHLVKQLNSKSDKRDYIISFNSVLSDFMSNVAVMRPESTIGKRLTEIKLVLKVLKKNSKYIDLFVQKVLIYKEKIDADNDSFFLEKDYDNDKEDVEPDPDLDLDELIDEMKLMWVTFTRFDKEIIMSYMKCLCHLSQEYFLLCIN